MKDIRQYTTPDLDYQSKIKFIEKHIDQNLKYFSTQRQQCMLKEAVMLIQGRSCTTDKHDLSAVEEEEGQRPGHSALQGVPEGAEEYEESHSQTSSFATEQQHQRSHQHLQDGEYFALRGSKQLKRPPSDEKNARQVHEAYSHSENVVMDLKDGLELDRLELEIDRSKNTIDLQLAVLEAERLKYRKLMRFQVENQQDSEKTKWARDYTRKRSGAFKLKSQANNNN